MIRGAGGKGGGGGGGAARAPVEAPDSIRSKQFARVVDLISEGEIGGLADSAKSVYLDNTPLQNPDGSYNFGGVSINGVQGTQSQSYLPGFPSVESEFPVGTKVEQDVSVTRTITNANVDKVRVTLGIPQLTEQNPTTGDISGSQVHIEIDVQANGGGFVITVGDIISGKTTSRYQRAYEIPLTGSAPFDIRVRRMTPDSISVSVVDDVYWDSYTEIIDSKLAYPNSALVALEIDAAQFNSIPTRGYDCFGIKCQIPVNYDPMSRTYAGTWDGTFYTAWTDNPAWCFYDLLTNERYGLGEYVDAAQVDKWALFTIGQYCDEVVPDGFGGFEPRFTCNLYLQTRNEAHRVLANMASIFRGMIYWGAGAIVPTADTPTDPVAMFNKANVVGGKFRYQGTARNTRHTVALVGWNDPADGYRQKIEYVEDREGIERYGVIETDIAAFGCTSRGQAHRMGKWILFTERGETETVTFNAGLDGVLVAPGDIILTQDAARAGKRFGGRTVSATVSAVTIDSAVTLEGGKTYSLAVVTPAGEVISSPVTNGPGPTTVLFVSPDLSAAPQADAIWVLIASDLSPEFWRVISVAESDKTQVEVTALKYDSTKYVAVEQGIFLEPPPTSAVMLRPPGVTNLKATESLHQLGPGVVGNRVTLSWTGSTGRYRVNYRSDLTNWVNLPETTSQTIELDGLTPDIYTFSVFQISAIGIHSPTNSLRQDIYGKLSPPANVTGFTVIKSNGVAMARWDEHADLDVRIGGFIDVRHQAVMTGAVWNNGVLMNSFDGGAVSGVLPLVTGTYLAKAVDSSGKYSEDAAGFLMTEGMVTGWTTLHTLTEAPTFAGTKVNCTVVSGELRLSSGFLFDAAPGTFDAESGLFDAFGGQEISGTYTFGNFDFGSVKTLRVEADIQFDSFDNADTFDERQGLFDDGDGLFDGQDLAINDAWIELYARQTDTDPAGSPVWGEWYPLHVNDVTARGVQFQLRMNVSTPAHNVGVGTLTVHAKEPA